MTLPTQTQLIGQSLIELLHLLSLGCGFDMLLIRHLESRHINGLVNLGKTLEGQLGTLLAQPQVVHDDDRLFTLIPELLQGFGEQFHSSCRSLTPTMSQIPLPRCSAVATTPSAAPGSPREPQFMLANTLAIAFLANWGEAPDAPNAGSKG